MQSFDEFKNRFFHSLYFFHGPLIDMIISIYLHCTRPEYKLNFGNFSHGPTSWCSKPDPRFVVCVFKGVFLKTWKLENLKKLKQCYNFVICQFVANFSVSLQFKEFAVFILAFLQKPIVRYIVGSLLIDVCRIESDSFLR